MADLWEYGDLSDFSDDGAGLGKETAKEAPQPSSKAQLSGESSECACGWLAFKRSGVCKPFQDDYSPTSLQPNVQIPQQAPDEEWILKEATRSSKRQPKRPSAGDHLTESERCARLLLNKATHAAKEMARMERWVEEAYGTPSHLGMADGCEDSAVASAVPESSRRVAARTSSGSSPLASPPSSRKADRAGRDSAGASTSHAAALASPPASGCDYLEVVFQWSSGSRSVVLPSDKPLRAEFGELRAALQTKGVCSDSDELTFIFDGDRLTGRQTPVELGLENGDVVDVRIERGGC